MAYPDDPIERDQFRFFRDRYSISGCEIYGKNDKRRKKTGRPWLVLSDDAAHRRKLAIVIPLTHASDRDGTERAFLVPEAKEEHLSITDDKDDGSHVDVQQLWTFPANRDETLRPIARLGEGRDAARIESKLTRYVGPRGNLANTIHVGRVVWIQPIQTRAPTGDRYPIELRLNWEITFDNHPPTITLPERIPCVIIAAPPGAPEAAHEGVSVLTLIPMLNIPWFHARYPKNAAVRPPWASSVDDELSVLTQLVLTLDYTIEKARIRFDDKQGHQSWTVTDAEHAVIRGQLLSHLGIQK